MSITLKLRYLTISLSLLLFNAHPIISQETEAPTQEELQTSEDVNVKTQDENELPQDENAQPMDEKEQPLKEKAKPQEESQKPEEKKVEKPSKDQKAEEAKEKEKAAVKKADDEKAAEKKEEEENKEDLILKSTGQWKEKEARIYRMPSSATRGIKGEKIPYFLWIDQTNWNETPKLNENAEKSFKSTNDDVLAIITTEPKQYALDQLDDIVIKNAKASGFEKASIVTEEKRIVNGTELLFIHWKASIKGEDVDFLSYLYSGKEGTIMVHTYTSSKLLEKNQKIMENLLNGLSFDHTK